MAILKTVGIVLNCIKYSDNDNILTLLTHDLGKISVMAKGVNKFKGKSAAALELMCVSKFVLFKGRGMYHLNEAELIQNFYDIRLDYDKTMSACHILKEANRSTTDIMEKNESYEIFRLTVAAVQNMQVIDKEELIKVTYMLKLMSVMGFKLDIISIEKENSEDNKNRIFNIYRDRNKNRNDGIEPSIINELVYISSEDIFVSKTIFNILKYITNAKVDDVFKYNTSAVNIKELNRFKDIYISNHM